MSKKNGTASRAELALLASKIGCTPDTDEGRKAFLAWLSASPKEARRSLFTRAAARRAAKPPTPPPAHRPINAAEAQALRTGEPPLYPRSWLQGRALGAASVVRGTGQKPVRSGTAPAAARHTPRVPVITEGRD